MATTQKQIISANPRHSSAKENWGTPPWILEAARMVLGTIDLDPASSAEANKVVQSRHYFTKADDGLSRIWRLNSIDAHRVNVWLNPPGGKTEKTEGRKGGESKVKLWWQKLLIQQEGPYFAHGLFLSFSIEACQVTQLECEYSLLDFPTCFFKRRSSCITYVPGSLNETHGFNEVFSELGRVTLGYTDRIVECGREAEAFTPTMIASKRTDLDRHTDPQPLL